jgi:hypothetical protein
MNDYKIDYICAAGRHWRDANDAEKCHHRYWPSCLVTNPNPSAWKSPPKIFTDSRGRHDLPICPKCSEHSLELGSLKDAIKAVREAGYSEDDVTDWMRYKYSSKAPLDQLPEWHQAIANKYFCINPSCPNHGLPVGFRNELESYESANYKVCSSCKFQSLIHDHCINLDCPSNAPKQALLYDYAPCPTCGMHSLKMIEGKYHCTNTDCADYRLSSMYKSEQEQKMETTHSYYILRNRAMLKSGRSKLAKKQKTKKLR